MSDLALSPRTPVGLWLASRGHLMGQLSPRQPLPASATSEQMRADLAAYRREAATTTAMRVAALAAGIIAAVSICVMVLLS